jgi:hypothetical protein
LENEKAVFHFRTGDGGWMFALSIMAESKAVSMGGGTSGSTASEQRVMFQSLGPHNPTLASPPAVFAHRPGKPRA